MASKTIGKGDISILVFIKYNHLNPSLGIRRFYISLRLQFVV